MLCLCARANEDVDSRCGLPKQSSGADGHREMACTPDDVLGNSEPHEATMERATAEFALTIEDRGDIESKEQVLPKIESGHDLFPPQEREQGVRYCGMWRVVKWTVSFMLLVVVAFAVVRFFEARHTSVAPIAALLMMGTVHIPESGYTARVEVARTPAERTQGLSGRPRLRRDQGMLFVFDQPDYHGIWMRDMRFSIDLVWVAGGVVIDTTERLPIPRRWFSRSLPVFRPASPALLVLEVPVGTVRQHRIQKGQRFVATFDDRLGG
ncbi:DUF192 domain-containing protein [Candidatus Uhrbacteria bacterium]|nr:DUF192 domain-containing protein [Candidatus Uhrbacteria bacterium]